MRRLPRRRCERARWRLLCRKVSHRRRSTPLRTNQADPVPLGGSSEDNSACSRLSSGSFFQAVCDHLNENVSCRNGYAINSPNPSWVFVVDFTPVRVSACSAASHWPVVIRDRRISQELHDSRLARAAGDALVTLDVPFSLGLGDPLHELAGAIEQTDGGLHGLVAGFGDRELRSASRPRRF